MAAHIKALDSERRLPCAFRCHSLGGKGPAGSTRTCDSRPRNAGRSLPHLGASSADCRSHRGRIGWTGAWERIRRRGSRGW